MCVVEYTKRDTPHVHSVLPLLVGVNRLLIYLRALYLPNGLHRPGRSLVGLDPRDTTWLRRSETEDPFDKYTDSTLHSGPRKGLLLGGGRSRLLCDYPSKFFITSTDLRGHCGSLSVYSRTPSPATRTPVRVGQGAGVRP